jgi:hypothetical protein
MHLAMSEARRAIANTDAGVRTWGAYQHYGNPYLQFFDPARLQPPRNASSTEPKSTRRPTKTRKNTKRKSSKKKRSAE